MGFRTHQNRFKVKKLLILGAGASYDASNASKSFSKNITPLDKDFTTKISELKVTRPHWVDISKRYIIDNWKDYNAFNKYGLENAIIRQLGHLEFIKSIHQRRGQNLTSEFDYLNHLSHIITFILNRAQENDKQLYATLSTKLFSEKKAEDIENRIITFNYDNLLDSHLEKKFGIRKLYFDRIRKKTEGKIRRKTQKFDHPLLIKLHGSINWNCTTIDFRQLLENKIELKKSDASTDNYVSSEEDIKPTSIDLWYEKDNKPSPLDDYSPFIVPPLPDKPITHISILNYLWIKAYEYLHEAEEIIICGYSLPDTDRLALSLFGNFENKNLKEVTIVDPSPVIILKWKDLFMRRNVSKKIKWSYYETFQEYVNAL